ncbi:putative glycosyltransferase [Vibrio sp. N418]|uniref:glycosyltransferase n=1 Tax=Vibrio sp. (strain N418) TaxID=701176 RepID=UPI00021C0A1F|nr:glycosyltransferase [Vibrio sp. N418]EGU33629.1 putative glycosyltransferase [Vibrio sp. N418]
MSDNVKVSVLMTCYMEPIEWIEQAVLSILEQKLHGYNIELILIIDHPSRTDVVELINSLDKNVIFVLNENNIGLVASLNLAFSLSSGDFIARMDADDYCSLDRIQRQMDFLKLNSEIDLVGCYVIRVSSNGDFLEEYKPPVSSEEHRKKLIFGSTLPHPTWLMRRTVMSTLDGYNSVYLAEDFDFLSRANRLGMELYTLPEFLFFNRINNSSVSNVDNTSQLLSHIFVVKKNILERISNVDERKYTYSPRDCKYYSVLQRTHILSNKLILKSKSVNALYSYLLVFFAVILSPLQFVRVLFVIMSRFV